MEREAKVRNDMATIFQDAQEASRKHDRNAAKLCKLAKENAEEVETRGDGRVQLVGERTFNNIFFEMVRRLLEAKAGPSGDRVAEFVALFIQKSHERDPCQDDEPKPDEATDTPATRLTAKLLNMLLKGCGTKVKYVRFRVVQLLQLLSTRLGKIDHLIYENLREKMIERSQDKEATIRAQAILCLCKLCRLEANQPLGNGSLEHFIVPLVAQDTSSEVRRIFVDNIPLNMLSVDALIERARDVDHSIAKLVYARLRKELTNDSLDSLQLLQVLSLEHYKAIIQNGINSRDADVAKAAKSLMLTLFDLNGGIKRDETERKEDHFQDDFVTYLKFFTNAPLGILEASLLPIFEHRFNECCRVTLDTTSYTSFERLLFIRAFCDYCVEQKLPLEKWEDVLPVARSLAYEMNQQCMAMHFSPDGSQHEPNQEQELILTEMLRLAVHLDYQDDYGRKEMESQIRKMLLSHALPMELIPLAVQGLRKMYSKDIDLIGVVTNIIRELMDEKKPLESTGSLDSNSLTQEAAYTASINRLCICASFLECLEKNLDGRTVLHDLYQDLILPFLTNQDSALRKQAISCLAQLCLLSKHHAKQCLPVFFHDLTATSNAEEASLRLLQLQGLVDVFLKYHGQLWAAEIYEKITMTLSIVLTDGTSLLAGIACQGLAKLVHARLIDVHDALAVLLAAYFSPRHAENENVKQCLAYFFPSFCTTASNQSQMLKAFPSAFKSTHAANAPNLAPMKRFTAMFVDWTNPLHIRCKELSDADSSMQFCMSADILELLLDNQWSKQDVQVLCQMLIKLHIPDHLDDDQALKIFVALKKLNLLRLIEDSTARNYLGKFEATIKALDQDGLADSRTAMMTVSDVEEKPLIQGIKREAEGTDISECEGGSISRHRKKRIHLTGNQDSEPRHASQVVKRERSVIIISSDSESDSEVEIVDRPASYVSPSRASIGQSTEIPASSLKPPHVLSSDAEDKDEVSQLLMGR